jgi:hypothetical protein
MICDPEVGKVTLKSNGDEARVAELEPKLLAGAGAGAGILKFRLPAPAPGQTKVMYLIIIHIE